MNPPSKEAKTISKRDKHGADIYNLIVACKAIEATSREMRRATLDFLWDKFIVNPADAADDAQGHHQK